ncbi:SDR family oxidoreductase [Rheinheimera oceanensis]|uniref:SDR family oxidoreductase n=1 Tax=Rheinheimera oceanensis TaxID=2817449 RepID=UPI001BFD3BF8|nr:SDR family oxidoreductase [Rheinheimera oceanensis]
MQKTWFITGTSTGLGRLMTEKLLARGDRVAATLRKAGSLDDLKAQYGDLLWVAQLDLTEVHQIREVVDAAFVEFGRIDIIVSNAGYGLFGAAEELNDAQISRQIATNLTGSIQLIRAALPHLREQGGGRIVQVSSEGGQISYPNFSLYHATKWGIEGFIEAVAQEVTGFGIDFMIAEPGPTRTNFAAALDCAQPSEIYADTSSGELRRLISSGGFTIRGDAANTVDVLIEAADLNTPPLRLVLGSTAYENIRAALINRLETLETQRDLALLADKKEN